MENSTKLADLREVGLTGMPQYNPYEIIGKFCGTPRGVRAYSRIREYVHKC